MRSLLRIGMGPAGAGLCFTQFLVHTSGSHTHTINNLLLDPCLNESSVVEAEDRRDKRSAGEMCSHQRQAFFLNESVLYSLLIVLLES